MPNDKIKFAAYTALIIAVSLGLSISVQSIFADWQAPANNPPTDYIAPLISTSSVTQIKEGTLGTLSSFIADGLTFVVNAVSRRVGIGTSTPKAKLEIMPGENEEGLRLTANGAEPLAVYDKDNKAIFSLDKDGIMTAKAVAPVEDNDVVTKGYVNAQASSGGSGGAITLIATGVEKNLIECPLGYFLAMQGYWIVPTNSNGMGDGFCSYQKDFIQKLDYPINVSAVSSALPDPPSFNYCTICAPDTSGAVTTVGAGASYPPDYKIIFITQKMFSGYNIKGENKADEYCQQEAESAGITGTFKAWLKGTDGYLVHSEIEGKFKPGTYINTRLGIVIEIPDCSSGCLPQYFEINDGANIYTSTGLSIHSGDIIWVGVSDPTNNNDASVNTKDCNDFMPIAGSDYGYTLTTPVSNLPATQTNKCTSAGHLLCLEVK